MSIETVKVCVRCEIVVTRDDDHAYNHPGHLVVEVLSTEMWDGKAWK